MTTCDRVLETGPQPRRGVVGAVAVLAGDRGVRHEGERVLPSDAHRLPRHPVRGGQAADDARRGRNHGD